MDSAPAAPPRQDSTITVPASLARALARVLAPYLAEVLATPREAPPPRYATHPAHLRPRGASQSYRSAKREISPVPGAEHLGPGLYVCDVAAHHAHYSRPARPPTPRPSTPANDATAGEPTDAEPTDEDLDAMLGAAHLRPTRKAGAR